MVRKIQVSKRAAGMNYAIREVAVPAAKLAAEGRKLCMFNIGDPNKWDFETPSYFKTALRKSVDHTDNGYGDSQGNPEFRNAIVDREYEKHGVTINAKDVFVTSGVGEAINLLMGALVEPGDEILVPGPGYPSYMQYINFFGGKVVPYRMIEEEDWRPDVDMLRKRITDRTKAIVVINPNNPTGALYDTDVLLSMLQVAREHDLIVFSDEIYDRLVMDGLHHVSTASLAPDLTVVTMNGLSKSHSLCGYRCGWMVISGPRAATDLYKRGITELTSMRLCSNALAQLVIPAALEDMETPASMVRPGGRYYEQRKATTEVLDTIDGISYVKNVAAFYLFPKLDVKKFGITSDKVFARDLLQATNILVVPGSGFDWAEPDHFRLVMLPAAGQLREAMTRMGKFLDGYHQK